MSKRQQDLAKRKLEQEQKDRVAEKEKEKKKDKEKKARDAKKAEALKRKGEAEPKAANGKNKKRTGSAPSSRSRKPKTARADAATSSTTAPETEDVEEPPACSSEELLQQILRGILGSATATVEIQEGPPIGMEQLVGGPIDDDANEHNLGDGEVQEGQEVQVDLENDNEAGNFIKELSMKLASASEATKMEVFETVSELLIREGTPEVHTSLMRKLYELGGVIPKSETVRSATMPAPSKSPLAAPFTIASSDGILNAPTEDGTTTLALKPQPSATSSSLLNPTPTGALDHGSPYTMITTSTSPSSSPATVDSGTIALLLNHLTTAASDHGSTVETIVTETSSEPRAAQLAGFDNAASLEALPTVETTSRAFKNPSTLALPVNTSPAALMSPVPAGTEVPTTPPLDSSSTAAMESPAKNGSMITTPSAELPDTALFGSVPASTLISMTPPLEDAPAAASEAPANTTTPSSQSPSSAPVIPAGGTDSTTSSTESSMAARLNVFPTCFTSTTDPVSPSIITTEVMAERRFGIRNAIVSEINNPTVEDVLLNLTILHISARAQDIGEVDNKSLRMYGQKYANVLTFHVSPRLSVVLDKYLSDPGLIENLYNHNVNKFGELPEHHVLPFAGEMCKEGTAMFALLNGIAMNFYLKGIRSRHNGVTMEILESDDSFHLLPLDVMAKGIYGQNFQHVYKTLPKVLRKMARGFMLKEFGMRIKI